MNNRKTADTNVNAKKYGWMYYWKTNGCFLSFFVK